MLWCRRLSWPASSTLWRRPVLLVHDDPVGIEEFVRVPFRGVQ